MGKARSGLVVVGMNDEMKPITFRRPGITEHLVARLREYARFIDENAENIVGIVDDYVPLRTCRNVCASVSEFICSECGFNCDLTSWISLFDGDTGKHRHHHHGTPNYCPNCGAKVVKE